MWYSRVVCVVIILSCPTVHGLETVPMRDTSGQQMVPVLKQPPKWESRLILPTSAFPNRGKEYTVSGVVLYEVTVLLLAWWCSQLGC